MLGIAPFVSGQPGRHDIQAGVEEPTAASSAAMSIFLIVIIFLGYETDVTAVQLRVQRFKKTVGQRRVIKLKKCSSKFGLKCVVLFLDFNTDKPDK